MGTTVDAANAPLAVQAAKRMMRMGLNETFPDHVHHVYLQLLPLFKTQDMQEGIRASWRSASRNSKAAAGVRALSCGR